jgi:hypothetical protein
MAICAAVELVDVLSNTHLEMHYCAMHAKRLMQALKLHETFYRVVMAPLQGLPVKRSQMPHVKAIPLHLLHLTQLANG